MDWSDCPIVERIPGKVSGQWIVKGTRILADGVLENADAGYTPEQLVTDIYQGLSIDQARAILSYAQRMRELGLPDAHDEQPMTDAHRQDIREKIAQGLASARQGKLVDGPSVFARIRTELDEIEQQGRR